MIPSTRAVFKFKCRSWPWFPRWLSGKESACLCRRPEFKPWLGKWRRKWQPTLLFLPGKSHRLGNERGCVPTVSRTKMRRGGEGGVEGHSCCLMLQNPGGMRPTPHQPVFRLCLPRDLPFHTAKFPVCILCAQPSVGKAGGLGNERREEPGRL